MFTIKSALALMAIAAGGFLNAGDGTAPVPAASVGCSQACAGTASPLPSVRTLQKAAELALLRQVRQDLQDPDSALRLSQLSFRRNSGRSLEGSGNGVVIFNGVGELPITVEVDYDAADSRVEHVTYRVTGAARQSRTQLLGQQMRSAIADRIGARLVLEFSQQPVDFSLLDINQLASGRNRVMISGNGVTRFPGEGAAFTTFVATADKFTGKILTVQYELLQEIEQPVGDSLASSN